MASEQTVFREMCRTNTQMARVGSQGRDKVRYMDAVARDIMERGGTRDIEEFVFAIHGLLRVQENGHKTIHMYQTVDTMYGRSAVGKLFIPSGISMATRAHVESPLYYVPARNSQRAGQAFNAATAVQFRIEKNDNLPPSTFVGKVVVPGLLAIRNNVRDITAEANVLEAEYEPKRFARFVGLDGQAPLAQFGVPPVPSPVWELDIVSTLASKKNNLFDMNDVADIAARLGDARSAFWQYESQRLQQEVVGASVRE